MAEIVISMVAETLGDLLIEEVKFIHGVRDEVRDLRDELWWMQCFLRDADAKQYDDHRVGTWVREIKELVYDAGDLLDSFIIKVESRRGGGILNLLTRFTCFVNEGIVLHKFGSEIAATGSRISRLTTRLQTYGVRSLLEDRGSSSSVNQRRIQFRRTDSRPDNEDIVGLKDDIEKLVEYLVTDDNGKVVAICGLGGLGKTTLAKRIYHHKEVKNHFECHVWICISQEWEPTNILQRILLKLTPDAAKEIYKERDIGRLTAQISKIQLDKKCLVVLDDIWHNDAAKFLKDVLSVESMKGKVLVTTRKRKVAEQLTPNVFIYKPESLTETECLELLQKKLVIDLNEPEKKELANEMIKECGGLPLAVVVLRGILATKQSLDEWRMVQKSIKSYIRRGEGMGQDEGGGVSKILGLSYNDLPYQLKSCFLYLGQFQEDAEIETERLYQLWTAESMIMSEDRREGETMMDVAEGYLKELAQRSMVQVELAEEYKGVGRFKSCSLHDLMRDLSLSNGKQENFFRPYDVQHEKNQEFIESSSSSTNRTRRAVVHHNGNSEKFPLDKETCQSLRSLFLHVTRDGRDSVGLVQMVKSTLNDLKMVRVLHFEGLKFLLDDSAIMKAVGKLCHLRYLSLENLISLIPLSYMNKLKHLQTLRVRGHYVGKFDLPYQANVLGKMSRLQHLYLPHYRGENPIKFKLKLDGLGKLQSLEEFDSSWCEFESLLKLTNLRKLRAVLRRIEEVVQIIEYLNSSAAKHMRHSKIRLDIRTHSLGLEDGCSIFSEILRCDRLYMISIRLNKCIRLPTHNEVLNISQSLKSLRLTDLKLDEDPMPTLEKLPKLQDLTLWDAFVGEEMVCCEEGFPELISLQISSMRYLQEWVVKKGAMPKLSKLDIYRNKNMKAIPDGLIFITTLRELNVIGMSEEFERRIKIEEDGIQGEDVRKIPSETSVTISPY